MATASTKPEQLTQAIESVLSQSPSSVGMKLKSDRELSKVLKVNEYAIRASLLNLEKKGLLVRKRGSGTFIRRLAMSPRSLKPGDAIVSAEDIFDLASRELTATDRRFNPNLGNSKANSSLCFSLVGDMMRGNLASQRAYAALSDEAGRYGHRLTLSSPPLNPELNYPEMRKQAVRMIAEQMADPTIDGFWIIAEWAEVFEDVRAQYEKEHGPLTKPYLYFGCGSFQFKVDPMVVFDTAEAVQQAVHHLTSHGNKKVAFIGLPDPQRRIQCVRIESLAYDMAIAAHRDTYKAKAYADPFNVGEAIQATRDLLHLADPPEAIYVSDDTLLTGVAEALAMENMVPGRDIAVITLSNEGTRLPGDTPWSRLEFSANRLAKVVVSRLLDMTHSGKQELDSMSLHARWIPGGTHYRTTAGGTPETAS